MHFWKELFLKQHAFCQGPQEQIAPPRTSRGLPLLLSLSLLNALLPPKNMISIVNTFSLLVFAETFPKPTLVKLLRVKYNAVKYFVCKSGPLSGTDLLYGMLVSCPSNANHPKVSCSSKLPMAYQTQANQCATNAKPNIKSISNAIPYSEYRSSLRATRTSLNKRAVFNKPINVVV